MKRKLLLRCAMGAPIGLALSTLITIGISFTVGDGNFYPVAPGLAQDFGGELNAVLAQAACSLLYGAAWGGATAVWEAERWSLLRQTATHLAVCSAATFPIAYLMRWMPHSAAGVLLYFAVFFGLYLLFWLALFARVKRRVRQLDRRVRELGNGDGPGNG